LTNRRLPPDSQITAEFVGIGIGLTFLLITLVFLVAVERAATRMQFIQSQVSKSWNT
jgi:hypothetical protein